MWLTIAAVSIALIAGAAWKMTRRQSRCRRHCAAAVPADDASASTKSVFTQQHHRCPVSEPTGREGRNEDQKPEPSQW